MSTRSTLVILHRWAGLTTALFLFSSGLTGAVIAWDRELDSYLNPQLFYVPAGETPMASTALAVLIEQRDPHVRVTYFPLKPETERGSLRFFVAPKIDSKTGRRFKATYNQVFLNPNTGEELGRRNSIASWPVTRDNIVSVLYRFHYSLQIPEFWGINRWGIWLLGAIATIWTFDCFVGLYLTLPLRQRSRFSTIAVRSARSRGDYWQRWKPAWRVKYSGSAYRINFDVHRAFGLWAWGLMLLLAVTGFSLNLYQEVFVPLLKTVSSYTSTPGDDRKAAALDQPILPNVSFAEAIGLAEREASQRHWAMSVGAIGYNAQKGIYNARLYKKGGDTETGTVAGNLFFDGTDGHLLGDKLAWRGTAADIVAQAQFPIHSGRILGLPGRILVSIMGLIVAALSVTGAIIWWRKQRARAVNKQRAFGTINSSTGSAG